MTNPRAGSRAAAEPKRAPRVAVGSKNSWAIGECTATTSAAAREGEGREATAFRGATETESRAQNLQLTALANERKVTR